MSQRPHVYPIDVECFECQAKPGEWCVGANGERRNDGYHRSRLHLANTGDVEAAKVIAEAGNQVVARLRKMHENRRNARRVRGAA